MAHLFPNLTNLDFTLVTLEEKSLPEPYGFSKIVN